MRRQNLGRLAKKLALLASGIFIIYFLLQIKIQTIKVNVARDTYHLFDESAFNRCISTLKGKNFWRTRLQDIRTQAIKCSKWIEDVSVDKKFPGIINLYLNIYKPGLRIKADKKCFLISRSLILRVVECKKLGDFSSLPVLSSKHPLDGSYDLLEQLLEFNKYCKAYLKIQPNYRLEEYAGRLVLVAKFENYSVILNPINSGSRNFTRFYHTIQGLKQSHIKYKLIVLLFDRVVIK